jgi:hypothetical protein
MHQPEQTLKREYGKYPLYDLLEKFGKMQEAAFYNGKVGR